MEDARETDIDAASVNEVTVAMARARTDIEGDVEPPSSDGGEGQQGAEGDESTKPNLRAAAEEKERRLAFAEAEFKKWHPRLGDASPPLVGEFKYPLEKPLGPVLCTSRKLRVGTYRGPVGGICKQIMKLGDGQVPVHNSTCFIHYDMWQLGNDWEVFSSRQESEPKQVILVTPKKKCDAGLAECIKTMVVGERALFEIPPELCYGSEGSFSFPSVGKDVWMQTDIELIGIKGTTQEPEIDRADMLYEERMERVKRHRERGNEHFRDGAVGDAAREYEMALSFLTDDIMMQLFGKYLDEANSEKLPAHLNLCACLLKLERWNDAIDQATRALQVEPNNPKAWYRRGRARMALGQDNAARKDLEKALNLSPEDPVVAKALAQLDREEQSKAKARRGVFGGLFGGGGSACSDMEDINDEAKEVNTSCEGGGGSTLRKKPPGSGFFSRLGQTLGWGVAK